MREIVVIAHNLRSAHNVGSLLRTAEGFGVKKVYMSGYTPYPKMIYDSRLPYLAEKIDKQIAKTALGAEKSVSWDHKVDVFELIARLKSEKYLVYALEQTADSFSLPKFNPPKKIAIILGREVEGVEDSVLAACDSALEIPMFGQKESFNVVQAAAICLYHCTFT